MRDVGRIRPFLDRIAEVWEKYPDLRFGQFVMDIVPDKDRLWNCEEDEFLKRMEKFVESISASKKSYKETSFEISGADADRLKRFKEQHKDCPMGMAFDKFSYTFIPTGLGMATKVKCSCGQTLRLGNFMDFEADDYDEKEHGPLSDENLNNKKFEEEALLILKLENPRYCRMAFGKEQSFVLLYTYVTGFALAADERIARCLLYKKSYDEKHNTIENYSGDEAEDIALFFGHFKEKLRLELENYSCKNDRLIKKLKEVE